MSAPTNIYVNRRLRLAATKSAMMIFSKLVVIIIIMDVWIRAFLNIPGGSIYALYKDILIVFLLALTVGLVVTNPKRIVRNKIDYFVLLYIVYAAARHCLLILSPTCPLLIPPLPSAGHVAWQGSAWCAAELHYRQHRPGPEQLGGDWFLLQCTGPVYAWWTNHGLHVGLAHQGHHPRGASRNHPEVGIPNAPVQQTLEMMSDPQTEALGIIQQGNEGGPSLMGLPLSFNGERPPLRRYAPKLGEHNDEIKGTDD